MARLFDSVAPEVKTISVDGLRDDGAGVLDPLLGLPSEGVVAGGGVAENFRKEGEHRLNDPRIGPRRRVIVHVDG
jgi:hypothetical protein